MVETPKDVSFDESGHGHDTDAGAEDMKGNDTGRAKRPQLHLRPRLRNRLHRLRRPPRRVRR